MDVFQGRGGLCLKVCWSRTLDKAGRLWRLTPLPAPVIPKVPQVLTVASLSVLLGGQLPFLNRLRRPAWPKRPLQRVGRRSRSRGGLCASISRRTVVMAALSETFLSLDTTTPSPPQSCRSNTPVFNLRVAIWLALLHVRWDRGKCGDAPEIKQ